MEAWGEKGREGSQRKSCDGGNEWVCISDNDDLEGKEAGEGREGIIL